MFNDFALENPQADFVAGILRPGTYWMGIYEDSKLIGVSWLESVQITDGGVHLFLFDAKIAERALLFRALIEWIFRNFPFNRLTIAVPVIYRTIIRLAKLVGFEEEGRRRGVYLMRGKWLDQALLGILRKEVVPNGNN